MAGDTGSEMLLPAAHEFTLGPTSLQGPLQHADVKTNGIWLYRLWPTAGAEERGRESWACLGAAAFGEDEVKNEETETSLEVQWLRLHTPNAGRPHTGRTDAEAEAPVLWPPNAKS